MADVTGGFNLRHAQITINGKNQIRNDYVPPMILSFSKNTSE